MRMVEIEWIDSVSHCDQTWHSREDLQKAAEVNVCYSTGYLFHEDGECLTVVMSYGDEEVGMALTIPKVAVKSVCDLTKV